MTGKCSAMVINCYWQRANLFSLRVKFVCGEHQRFYGNWVPIEDLSPPENRPVFEKSLVFSNFLLRSFWNLSKECGKLVNSTWHLSIKLSDNAFDALENHSASSINHLEWLTETRTLLWGFSLINFVKRLIREFLFHDRLTSVSKL